MYTKLCTKLWVAMDSLKRDERGVSAIEYAILVAVVVAAVAAGVSLLDIDGPDGPFGKAQAAIEAATN